MNKTIKEQLEAFGKNIKDFSNNFIKENGRIDILIKFEENEITEGMKENIENKIFFHKKNFKEELKESQIDVYMKDGELHFVMKEMENLNLVIFILIQLLGVEYDIFMILNFGCHNYKYEFNEEYKKEFDKLNPDFIKEIKQKKN